MVTSNRPAAALQNRACERDASGPSGPGRTRGLLYLGPGAPLLGGSRRPRIPALAAKSFSSPPP
eukprot:3270250-Pyramimonas_sp.AAC.1